MVCRLFLLCYVASVEVVLSVLNAKNAKDFTQRTQRKRQRRWSPEPTLFLFLFLSVFPPLRSYQHKKNAKKALAALEVLRSLRPAFALLCVLRAFAVNGSSFFN
jgi:hypothetical protein